VYTVEDEGSGIAENQVERVFDIYESKPEGEVMGVGLGLPLSRRLARLLGGELLAVARPNQGARFVLELPAASQI
jgi:signal transduction histidine kinase